MAAPGRGFLVLASWGDGPFPAPFENHSRPGPGMAPRFCAVPSPAAAPLAVAHLSEPDLELIGALRLDAGDELAAALGFARRPSDAELVASAYRRWGDRLLEHLAGDYGFALWDRRAGRLVAGRDPLGRRALYVRGIGATLALASSLSELRELSPRIDTVDENSLCDFLRCEGIVDPARTAFVGIDAIAPGRLLLADDSGLRTVAGRELRLDRLSHRDPEAAIEDLRERLGRALRDRVDPLRGAALSLSGGVDSTLLAALGHRAELPLEAITLLQDQLAEDLELPWAKRVCAHLGLPHHEVSSRPHTPWHTPRPDLWALPEPSGDPFLSLQEETFRRVAALGLDVLLSGEGGDDALYHPPRDAFAWVARHPLHAAREIARERRRSGLPRLGLRSHLRELLTVRRSRSGDVPAAGARGPRAGALANLQHPRWRSYLRSIDPFDAPIGVDLRLPYLDERVLGLLLALPPLPLARRKRILREAGRGLLPDAVVDRPKTFFPGDPVAARLVAGSPLPALDRPEHPLLRRWLPAGRPDPDAWTGLPWPPWDEIRGICLDFWLRACV